MANITRKQALEFAISRVEDNAEVTEVLRNMLKQVSKPRAKQVSKARKANEGLVHKVWRECPEKVTTNEVKDMGIPEIMTTQKASAVLRVGCELGLFEKVTEGKKVTYKRLDPETDED